MLLCYLGLEAISHMGNDLKDDLKAEGQYWEMIPSSKVEESEIMEASLGGGRGGCSGALL